MPDPQATSDRAATICDRCGQPGATEHRGTFNFHIECPPPRGLYDRLPDAAWLIRQRLQEAGVTISDDEAGYAAVAALEAFLDHPAYRAAREERTR